MKKLFVFGLLLVGLSLTGCTFKKDNIIEPNNKIVPSESHFASTSPTEGKIKPVLPATTTDPMAGVIVKRATSSDLASSSSPTNTNEQNNYTCAESPIKISSLKIGDTFNSHKIIKLYPEEKNIKGGIEFQSEETVSGSLYINKNAKHGDLSISFVPDDKNWLPAILNKNDKKGNSEGAELVCGAKSFDLFMPVLNYDKNVQEREYPLLTDKLSDFKSFWLNTKDSAKYPKKVQIKISGINLLYGIDATQTIEGRLVEVLKVLN